MIKSGLSLFKADREPEKRLQLSIHTSQGLEFDYVGVIIGNDMRYEDGKVVTDFTKMTRGMKGCYVYCVDEGLAEYLRECLNIRKGTEKE